LNVKDLVIENKNGKNLKKRSSAYVIVRLPYWTLSELLRGIYK